MSVLKSKSTVTILSVAVLGWAIMAPAAMAHGFSGGNSFQIPNTAAFALYQGAAQRGTLHVGHTSPPVLRHSSSNPKCAGAYGEMDRSEAGNGVGLVMMCR